MDVEQVTGEQVCWGRWEEVPVSQPHRQENNVCECYISWSAALFMRKGSGFVCMVDTVSHSYISLVVEWFHFTRLVVKSI